MLSIRGLKARIGENEVLRGIDLEVNAGEIHAMDACCPARSKRAGSTSSRSGDVSESRMHSTGCAWRASRRR